MYYNTSTTISSDVLYVVLVCIITPYVSHNMQHQHRECFGRSSHHDAFPVATNILSPRARSPPFRSSLGWPTFCSASAQTLPRSSSDKAHTVAPPNKNKPQRRKRVHSHVRHHNTFYTAGQSVRGTYCAAWEHQCNQNLIWCATVQTHSRNKPQRRSELTKMLETTVHAVSCTGLSLPPHSRGNTQQY